MFLIFVVGLISYGPVRSAVAHLQQMIAYYIGDSYALLGSRLIRGAILTQVRQDLFWLAPRCRRVAIIAHSQGGAIAHDLLRGDPTLPCDLLLTFGSGLHKLSDLRDARGATARWLLGVALGTVVIAALVALLLVFWPGLLILSNGEAAITHVFDPLGILCVVMLVYTACFFPMLMTAFQTSGTKKFLYLVSQVTSFIVGMFLLYLMSREFERSISYWVLTVVFLAAMVLTEILLGVWRLRTERSLDRDEQWALDRTRFDRLFSLANPRLEWRDAFSSADPVPNGPLLDELQPGGMGTREVHVRHSPVFDHNAYWESRDDFVPRVGCTLLYLAGIDVALDDPDDVIRQNLATCRRWWRVRWLVASRYLAIAAAGLFLCVWWNRGLPGVTRASDWLARLLSGAKWLERFQQVITPWTCGLLLLAFIVLAWYGTSYGIWRIWDAFEMKRRYRRLEYGWWAPFTFSAWLVISTAGSITWAGYSFNRVGVSFSGGAWGVALSGLCGLLGVTSFFRLAATGNQREADRQLGLWEMRRLRRGAAQGRTEARLELGRHLAGKADRIKNAVSRGLAREAGGTERADILRGEAHELWKQAMQAGSAHAAFLLASDMERHDGSADKIEAAYRRGFELGDAHCGYFLGTYLESRAERELPEDDQKKLLEEAKRWYEKALARGVPLAAHRLGHLAAKNNVEEAEEFYRKGIELRDGLSALWLADSLVRRAETLEASRQQEAEPEAEELRRQAESLYGTAIQLGEAGACVRLGELLSRRGAVDVARETLSRGARLHDVESALKLASLLKEEGDTRAALDVLLELSHLLQDRLQSPAPAWNGESRDQDEVWNEKIQSYREQQVEVCREQAELWRKLDKPAAAERADRLADTLEVIGKQNDSSPENGSRAI